MTDLFYDAPTPEEALAIYFRNDSDLYGRVKNRDIERRLLTLMRSSRPFKVLEIGAGGGTWTEFFLRRNAQTTSVDICGPVLEGNKRLHPGARFLLADGTALKLDERFDLVFAKDLIEHVPDDRGFLRNMNTHLKDNGRLFLTTQNSLSLNYLIEGSWNFLRGGRNWSGWDPTHVRFYSPRSLKNKLNAAGFSIEQWFGFYYVPYKFLFSLAERLLRKPHRERYWPFLHPVESMRWNDKFPFNFTGWNVGVIARKTGSGQDV